MTTAKKFQGVTTPTGNLAAFIISNLPQITISANVSTCTVAWYAETGSRVWRRAGANGSTELL